MHSQLAEFIGCQSRLIGSRDRAGRNEWLGQETGHNSAARPTMPLAATMRRPQPVWVSPRMRRQRVAPRFSVGSNKHPRHHGREYGRTRFTWSEFRGSFRRSTAALVCRLKTPR